MTYLIDSLGIIAITLLIAVVIGAWCAAQNSKDMLP